MADKEVYVVPFSRMMLYGLGNRDVCSSRSAQVISRTLHLMEVRQDLHFLLEDANALQKYLVAHPEFAEAVRSMVSEGRLEVGANWVTICQNLQLGEDLVRNLMKGARFSEEVLGKSAETAHLGDASGLTPQFIQLAGKAGLKGVVTSLPIRTERAVFHFVGLDGSLTKGWSARLGSEALWAATQGPQGRRKARTARIVAGMGGDSPRMPLHWGGGLTQPSEDALEHLADWSENTEFQVNFCTASSVIESLKGTVELEEVKGESPSLAPFLESVYPGIIPLQVPAVNGLLVAEQFAGMASWMTNHVDPRGALSDAWSLQLESMDCHYEGCEAIRILNQRAGDQESVIQRARRIRSDAQGAIAEQVSPGNGPAGTLPIVVFNSLGWRRSDVADAVVNFFGDENPGDFSRYELYKIVSKKGETVPFQEITGRQTISAQMQLRFVAKDVPAHGFSTFYLVPNEPESATLIGIQAPGMVVPDFPEPSFVIEDVEDRISEPYRGIRVGRKFSNTFYDLDVDETTGNVGIYDRKLERWLVQGITIAGREENLEAGLNQYAYTGRKYELAVDRVDLESSGEVEAVLLITGRLASSPVEIRYHLYGEIDRIDVSLSLEWRDEKPVRVQMVFPFGEGDVRYGIPFGHNSLDNVIANSGPWREEDMDRETWLMNRECQGWIAVDREESGAVLASDRRAFEFHQGEVRGDVLRSCPDPASFSYHKVWRTYPDKVRCRYSLRGYRGDFAEGQAYRDGLGLNQSLDTRCVYDTESPKSLPGRMSFVELEGTGIVTSAVKPAEDGEGFVLRAYEVVGRAAEAKLLACTGLRYLYEADPLENRCGEIDADGISFHPFEIKTLRFDMEPRK
jgi:alpha-mannosidase